jgi:CheY-like chemotaxis protein
MRLERIQPILLVEDEVDDEAFVRRALGKARIRNPVIMCSTPAGARKQVQQLPAGELPILAIVDIFLPGRETGLDFLRWLRAQGEPLGATPAMIYTTSTQSEHREEARGLGDVVFIRKPVDEETFSTAAQSLGFVVAMTQTDGRMERIIQPRHGSRSAGR